MVLAQTVRRSAARAAGRTPKRVFPFTNQAYKVKQLQRVHQTAGHTNHRHTKGGKLFWSIAAGVTVFYTVPSTISLITLQLFNRNG
jgi:hypothetical protein